MTNQAAEIIYTRATAADSKLLTESRITFMNEFWGKQEDAVEQRLREELMTFFKEEVRDQTYVAYLAKVNDELVGVGGMKISRKPGSFRIPNGLNAYIMNMYTDPTYRKRGIAKRILELLLEDGKALGVSFFELHATKEGEPVYQKSGFQLHDQPTYRKIVLGA